MKKGELWKVGKQKTTVVSTHPVDDQIPGSDSTEYYGGYLVAESVAPSRAPLLAASPKLYKALKELVRCVRGGDQTAGVSMDDALLDADSALEDAGI